MTNDRLHRAQGCLLGQLAGDALGSMVEFRSGAAIRAAYPDGLREIGPSAVWGTLPGQPTDDSELALSLARTLIRAGRFDDEAIAGAYVDWLESPPFDIGTTTSVALHAMERARHWHESLAAAGRQAAKPHSEANGALMRQSPLGIWGHALDPELLDDYTRRDTTLTHPNPVCQDASVAFVVALGAVVREGLDGAAAHGRAVAWDAAHGRSAGVTAALAGARDTPPRYQPSEGHVIIALHNAFYQALHAPDAESGIVETVMGGGDTDTNAAIAGALLGAIHGVESIPVPWRDAVLSCRPARGTAGVLHPRPEQFWPGDALTLAADLLAGGTRAATEY